MLMMSEITFPIYVYPFLSKTWIIRFSQIFWLIPCLRKQINQA